MQARADVFKALADPTRRAILSMLMDGERSVATIASEFPVSRPAISKHLKLLKGAHLVIEYQEGRNRLYHINPRPLREVDVWLAEFRVMWQSKLHNLKNFLESENKERR